MQHLDHRIRRGARHEGADPGVHVVTGEAAFGNRRHIRQHGCALLRSDGDGFEFAGFDVGQQAGQGREDVRHLVAEHIGDGRAGAFVWQVHKLQAGERFQIRHGEVAGRADAAAGVGAGARIVAFGLLQKFRQGGGRRGRVGGEELRQRADQGHAAQVALGVERQLGVERLVDRVAVEGEADGVAVRQRLGDVLGGDGATGAGAVFHQHRLLENFGQARVECAGNRIGAAAGGKADDQADRPFGGERLCRRNQRCGGQQGGSEQLEKIFAHDRMSPRIV